MSVTTVRTSLVAVWLKTRLELTETMLLGSSPNTLFGFIPAGRNDISQPLNRVSRVQVSTKVGAVNVLIGLICILAALNSRYDILFWILGVIAFATSYRTRLVVTDSGGGSQDVYVSPLDNSLVQTFANTVNARLATLPDR